MSDEFATTNPTTLPKSGDGTLGEVVAPRPSASHSQPTESWFSWLKGSPNPEQPAIDSSREVVETVVFVIVLVLLLKSFVAEAFVIPTGSMAETLWGYQKVVDCPSCNYRFPVNSSREAEPSDGMRKELTESCVCPNCQKAIDIPKVRGANGNTIGTNPTYTSGDRVLVAKFLYDLFARDPDRLDVVVFKFPGDSVGGLRFPTTGPFRNHTPMNYIKRLIGLPGEVIAIHCGKLYALSREKVPEHRDIDKNQLKPDVYSQNLWQHPFAHENDSDDLKLFRKGEFKIIRKAPENVLSMRRIVYDHDHPPTDLEGVVPSRWNSGKGSWKAISNQGFAASGGDGEDWLHYNHLVRDSSEGKKYSPQLISDLMGYNSYNQRTPTNGRNWVGDLMLEVEVTVKKDQGELILELSKANDRFQARFNLGDGACKMVRVTETESDPTVSSQDFEVAKTPVRKGTYRLRLANVDNRLLLWVDGKLIFPDGISYETSLTPIATRKNDLNRPASIGVQGADVEVHHLKLFRDTYYTTKTTENYSLKDADSWKNMENSPVLTYYIQPEHFLCLGDNSPESSDSRSWGLVPRRLLLGRALAVYYPFYFPFWPLSSQVNRVGLIH